MVDRPIDLVLSRLEVSSERDGQYECRCPAHDDQKASLGVREGDDGKVILYCQAGCNTLDVVTSMGLEMRDLFASNPTNGNSSSAAPKNGKSNSSANQEQKHRAPEQATNHNGARSAGKDNGSADWDPFEEGRQAAVYAYVDENYGMLFEVVRFELVDPSHLAYPDKAFRQRVPKSRGDWTWKTKGIRRVLYRLPTIQAAIERGDTVYVTEGEKDVHNLEGRGLVATTNPGGAKKWRREYSEQLAGGNVVILPDNDTPGEEHAKLVADSLLEVAASVKIVRLPGLTKKGDVSDWLDDGGTKAELERLVSAAPELKPMTNGKPPHARDRLTDLGNAERLIDRHGEDLRFCHPQSICYVWDGTRWTEDTSAAVMGHAIDTVKSLYAEAALAPDSEKRQALASHAKKSENANRLRAMVQTASWLEGVQIRPDELDTDPNLLNVRNGTLDLVSGRLRPHSRSDLITRLAPVRYDPGATCPAFLAFLDRVMDRDKDLIAYLQRLVGYSLTGLTGEQVMPILYGKGANGKSTFIETVSAILGDYAQQTPTETLVASHNRGIPNDLARLRGARFVSAVETGEGNRLDERLVKQMTGGDRITARFLRQEFFEFTPTFKLFLATNHKPVIRGTDEAIWRRLHLIPFRVMIPEGERDPTLKLKLADEASGILNWALAGCRQWREGGLQAPEDVKASTKEYREEMDVLALFINERCVKEAGARIQSSALYKAYTDWCDGVGEQPLSTNTFSLCLEERGYKKRRMSPGSFWLGLGLLSNP